MIDADRMIRTIIEYLREYQGWVAPVSFFLAFCESIAFVSMPTLLLAVGALVGVSEISFWPIWLAAALGAGLGDWVSYWMGRTFGNDIGRLWPFSRHPTMLLRAQAFFERWGMAGVLMGRFFGPLRAMIPLVAGSRNMPQRRFLLANFASAFLWAAAVLAPGKWGIQWIERMLP